MRWYPSFINRINQLIWRRRLWAAVFTTVALVVLAPIFFSDDIEFPIRYVISGAESERIDAVVILNNSLPLPTFTATIFTIVFVMSAILSLMAIFRILGERHWAWFWIVLFWPLAPLYYWFGPDDVLHQQTPREKSPKQAKKFPSFVHRIVQAIWRKRMLAAVLIALKVAIEIPLWATLANIHFPVTYVFSGALSAPIEAVVFFNKQFLVPAFCSWIGFLLFGITVFLSVMALLRILIQRHWVWSLVIYAWPLAPLYYWFGPDENP